MLIGRATLRIVTRLSPGRNLSERAWVAFVTEVISRPLLGLSEIFVLRFYSSSSNVIHSWYLLHLSHSYYSIDMEFLSCTIFFVRNLMTTLIFSFRSMVFINQSTIKNSISRVRLPLLSCVISPYLSKI